MIESDIKGDSITFDQLNILSHGDIHEVTYSNSALSDWMDGETYLLEESKAPSFIKEFIGFKKRPESSRYKTPWYFGEACLSAKLADSTKEGWYSSFKWLYAKKWLTGEGVQDGFETLFYEKALINHIGHKKLKELFEIWKDVNGFPSKPMAPDLWLIDNNGKHHFIEVKTWRWNLLKDDWDKDWPSKPQLGGLAIIEKYLNHKVYIVWLYPEDKKPYASWQKYIDQFNDFKKRLP